MAPSTTVPYWGYTGGYWGEANGRWLDGAWGIVVLSVTMSPDIDPIELTEREEAFSLAVVGGLSLKQAYRDVYGSPETLDATCCNEGYRISRRPRVRERIRSLTTESRRAASDVTKLDVTRLLKLYFELAMADPNELIGVRVGCCRYCHGEDFQYQWRQHEYLEELAKWETLPVDVRNLTPMPAIAGGLDFLHSKEPRDDCPACNGEGVERVVPRDTTQLTEGGRLLYQGVKKTRNGLEIVMADRSKMLENLGRILGAFKDNASVSVSVRAAIQAVTLAAADPAQAQAAYMQMLEADGTNS